MAKEIASEVMVSIGTAARLAGVSTHMLRVWEKRYGLNLSQRDGNGRRLYSQASIETLKLIRQAMALGYKISELAPLSTMELLELNLTKEKQHEDDLPTKMNLSQKKWLVYGMKVSHALFKQGVSKLFERTENLSQLFNRLKNSSSHQLGVVVEFSSLTESEEAVLYEVVLMTGRSLPIVTVVEDSVSEAVLNRIHKAGIILWKESFEICLSDFLREVTSTEHEHFPQDQKRRAIPDRLSHQNIDRLLQSPTNIYCECPTHISTIYTELDNFIRYVNDCELLSPKDKVLHKYMGETLTDIRQQMTKLAFQVASMDGIELIVDEE